MSVIVENITKLPVYTNQPKYQNCTVILPLLLKIWRFFWSYRFLCFGSRCHRCAFALSSIRIHTGGRRCWRLVCRPDRTWRLRWRVRLIQNGIYASRTAFHVERWRLCHRLDIHVADRKISLLTLSVHTEYIYSVASQATSPDGVYILRDFHKVVKWPGTVDFKL
jgi:hypothetical protein